MRSILDPAGTFKFFRSIAKRGPARGATPIAGRGVLLGRPAEEITEDVREPHGDAG